LLEALAVAGFITTATKIAVGRARPWRNRGDGFFLPARWDDGQWSFPSGHATIGGTILGVAVARSQSEAIHVGAAAVALTIAWARIYTDQHWASDVIAGTTIGATVGYALARHLPSSAHWQLYPLPNGIGIGAAW
jgi:membrane-associated phospholipid phosphatase